MRIFAPRPSLGASKDGGGGRRCDWYMARYKVGLALSGGSVKGFAHIGVLRYLDEIGVRPDIIAGTSAGALVGAFYADGYKPDEIFELMSSLRLGSMTNLRPLNAAGLLNTSPFEEFLTRHLRHKRIEELPTPLRIVATDLDRGESHTFREGELGRAVRASCSIPVLFHPVEIDGTSYVDGGLFRNFPASIIRDECQVLIGMNLGPWEREHYTKSIVSVAERSWSFVFRQNTLLDKEVCDILLETHDVLGYGMFDTDSAAALAEVGYEVARRELTRERLEPLCG